MDEYSLRTEHLCVGYDGKALIRDIDICVGRGEIVALIGPNGSGKSTILKSITRQLKALGGTVFVESEELRRLSFHDLSTRMAVVLTERIRPELMTCRDVVAAGRYPYTGRLGILSARDEAQVESAMAAVRVTEIANRDFNAISDGQRQRVMLARAICQQPDIIVLDEPTSFLDIGYKLQLLGLLRDMAKRQGMTVILSMHEIELTQKIADRVVCVKGERITRFGPPEAVLDAETIRALYDIDEGSYDPMFGSVELPRPDGAPETFVICGGGVGIPVFRRLQRENVPFIAGILHENDVDYLLASRLASRVVSEKPFESVGRPALEAALEMMADCRRIINARPRLGEANRAVAELIARAKQMPGYEETGSV